MVDYIGTARLRELMARIGPDRFIEELAREGITSGCGATTYCPDDPVTRAEMAVFLVRAFNLPL